jgi:uncharacterized protein
MGKIIESDGDIEGIVKAMRRIAVVGIKTETEAQQPAYDVPKYLQQVGFEVIPVPVYFPEATHILGRPVFRSVAAIEGELDVVVAFRRAKDLPQHLEDFVAKKPKVVWFQLGIQNDEIAAALVRAGIDVVQDRCLMVEHRRFT